MKTKSKTSTRFTDEERSAMKERVRELKAASSAADAESEMLAKIAEMPPADRSLAERVHALITSTAPGLAPRTYYGMPAYALGGKVVCWFKSADKFKTRYATIGFSDRANLDDGEIWPTEYALIKVTAAGEAKIAALIRRAVS